jgi:hypothetical protein
MLRTKRPFTDIQRALDKTTAFCIGRERALPVRPEPIEEIARAQLRAARRVARACDQIERERVKQPRARPSVRVVVNGIWVNRGHYLEQRPQRPLSGFALQPRPRNRPHEPMQADRIGRDRRIALVENRLAINEPERSERRDRLVQPVA